MSGGTSRTDTGTPRPPETPKCLELYPNVQVYSPNDEVLERLKVGDKLEIKAIIDNGKRSWRVFYANETLGSVLDLPLISCLEQGLIYIPTIVSIEDGSCFIDAELIS